MFKFMVSFISLTSWVFECNSKHCTRSSRQFIHIKKFTIAAYSFNSTTVNYDIVIAATATFVTSDNKYFELPLIVFVLCRKLAESKIRRRCFLVRPKKRLFILQIHQKQKRAKKFAMAIILLRVTVATSIVFASYVGAFSSGVGSCGAGDTSIQNTVPGNTHISGTSGPLADAGVNFLIDGIALIAGKATSFPVATDLQWSVDASKTSYKGIFVRVEATGDFTHVGDPAFVGTSLLCSSFPGVIGVNHISSNAKTSVTGTSNFNSVGTVTVDIVVVFSFTQWAYSTYSLTIDKVAAPNEIPVQAPTEIPIAVPIEIPVAVPTVIPVAVPTVVPVAVPTVIPVEVPTVVSVAVPTEIPVAAPFKTPLVPVATTETPLQAPAKEPIKAPVEIPVDTPFESPSPLAIPMAPVDASLTTKVPINKPPKTGKVMDMKMGDKNKKGIEAKIVGEKEEKGMMKRHNLRF